MALVVFLRGINVGGHRRFRPRELADALTRHDVVNVGAAGTLVVRKPGSRTAFRETLRRRLPFEAEIALCEGRELLRLAAADPFAGEPADRDVVQFVSILSRARARSPAVPLMVPADGIWYVNVRGVAGRLVYGVYRRHMKTIGYLGQLDQLFGVPATTRSWSTILAAVRVLDAGLPESNRRRLR